jgi:hypothetical protein
MEVMVLRWPMATLGGPCSRMGGRGVTRVHQFGARVHRSVAHRETDKATTAHNPMSSGA